jgi:hypothetical protein
MLEFFMMVAGSVSDSRLTATPGAAKSPYTRRGVHSRRDAWIGAGLALLLSAAQLRLIVLLLRNDYGRSIQAARGVVEGRPQWREFQNRILGPYAAEGLATVFPSYHAAHVALSIAVLAGAGVLAWRLGERIGGRASALSALIVLHLAFALLLANPAGSFSQLYLWDFIDVLVFVLFVDFVAAQRPWPWFAALAVAAVLNHEIAVFIAGWLIVDPLARWLLARKGVIPAEPLARRRILAGVLSVVASLLIVELTRAALLVADVGASFRPALGANLETLQALSSQFAYSMPQLVPLYVLGVVATAVALARRDRARFLGLCTTYLALIASLLAFSPLLETRVYVVLIPLFVLGAALITRPHARWSWLGAGLALLLAMAQLRLIVMLLRNDYGQLIQAARGVVEGRPHWRVFQNRILGPYAAEALSALFPSYVAAHVSLSIAALAAAGIAAFRLGERAGSRSAGLLALVAFHLGFTLLLALSWIYIWDFITALVFLLFVQFVAAERPWPWIAALAIVGVLNHEIAVFIAGWLVVDPPARWALGRMRVIPAAPLDRLRMLCGALVAAASLVVVERLRTALLVAEIGPEIFPRTARTAGESFHFALGDNLTTLKSLASISYGLPQLVPLYVLAAIGLVVSIARRDPRRFVGLSATHLAMIATLLTFGLLLETRLYIVLLPVVALGAVLLTAAPARPAD